MLIEEHVSGKNYTLVYFLIAKRRMILFGRIGSAVLLVAKKDNFKKY